MRGNLNKSFAAQLIQEVDEKLMGRIDGRSNEDNDGPWEVMIRDTV